MWTFPSKACPCCSPSSWWSPVVITASLQSLLSSCGLLSACLCSQASLSLERCQALIMWPILVQNDLILTGLHLQRPHVHIRSHSQVWGARTSAYLLGDTVQPTRSSIHTAHYCVHVSHHQHAGPHVCTDSIPGALWVKPR